MEVLRWSVDNAAGSATADPVPDAIWHGQPGTTPSSTTPSSSWPAIVLMNGMTNLANRRNATTRQIGEVVDER